MRKPIEEAILDDIKEAIAGISTAAGYSFDALRVEDVQEPFNTAEHRKLVVAAGDYQILGRDTEEEYRSQMFEVLAWWMGEPDADPAPNRRLIRMGADIVKALRVDPRRGGYAMQTDNVGAELFADCIVQRVSVTYLCNTNDPRVSEQTA
jgi:hypothetical protein